MTKGISNYLMLSTMMAMNAGGMYSGKYGRTSSYKPKIAKINAPKPLGLKNWSYEGCWVEAITKKSAIKKMIAYLIANDITPNEIDIKNRIKCF